MQSRNVAVEIRRKVVNPIPPTRKHARLLEVANAVAQDAGGNEDEEEGGDLEEEAQIDGYRAPVDQPADDDGNDQTGDNTQGRRNETTLRGGLDCGPHEDGGFQAFAPYRDDGDPDQSPAARTVRDGSTGLIFQTCYEGR